jgi:hypothetical protein
MNLSGISLTKNLGCPFLNPREATLGLKTNIIGSGYLLRDLDPFAFDLRPALSHRPPLF